MANNNCGNRNRQMLFTVNTNRFTPESPYVQNAQGQLVYTQDQLNMRRKAEILLYPHSNQNSKKNGITKKQRWTQIVNSAFPQYTECPELDLQPTPTYFSGIPGPVRYLIRDPTVPLYQFNNITQYAITNNDDPAIWKSSIDNNVLCQNEASTTLFTLFFTNNVKEKQKSFRFSTPYAVYIQGTTTLSNSSIRIPDISLNINSVDALLLYKNTPTDMKTIVSFTNPSIVFDISLNTVLNKTYSLYYYAGILTIDIPLLYTQPGYIFDLIVAFNMEMTLSTLSSIQYNSTFDKNVSVICNLANRDVFGSQGTVLKSSQATPSPQPFQPYQLVEL